MKAIVKTAIAMFALVAVAAQAAAPNVTELRKEAERLEGVWNSMRSDTRLNELAPDEMARTAKIMEKVSTAQRWHDADLRDYWNYKAVRLMELAKARASLVEQERAVADLEAKQADLTQRIAQREAERQLALRTAQEDAERSAMERRLAELEAELARQKANDALTEAERAAQQAQVAKEGQVAAELGRARAEAEAARAREEAAIARAEAAEAIAKLQTSLADLQTEKSKRGLVVTLGDVLFEVNGFALKPGATRNLDKIASYLRQFKNAKASIEGHTDSTGAAEYNNQLSQKRAEAVLNYLVGLGVEEDRLSAKGFGQPLPVAPNDTPEGRQRNRRVEVVLTDTDLEDQS